MTKPGVAWVMVLAMAQAGMYAQQSSNPKGAEKKTLVANKVTLPVQTPQSATDDPTYLIGPQDVLDITVWKEPDFSRAVPVRPDGKISLPLLNDVQAAGLTPTQLATTIMAMLRKYVTQPQVTVIVTQINSKRVFVIGEVNRPGPAPMLPGMTVLQVLSISGGFTQFANAKAIYVLRNENGKEVRLPFNYKNAIRGESFDRNIVLKPGDTIVVP